MRYQGSEAYSFDAAERRRDRSQRGAANAFEVVTGGGLDARARAGVTPTFVARVRVVLIAAACLIVLGMARVALSTATVSILSANSELSGQVEDAETLNEQLRVQRSVLSSSSRISRIATQNYGMVLSSDFVTVDLTDDSTPVDGDAAQTPDVAGTQAELS